MTLLRQGDGGQGQLPPEAYRDLVRDALAEDRGRGDVTSLSTIPAGQQARGVVVAKAAMVIAGLEVAAEAFRQADPAVVVEVRWSDGAHVQAGEIVAMVTGNARALLAAERAALNFLQRLSGIATLTAAYVDAAAGRITILDTRKTTPGFRALEKYAVRCGGGTNHRQRLDDGILIKDNHKRLAGGVRAAAERALRAANGMAVEIEVETLAELDEVLQVGVPRILLDNFTLPQLRATVPLIRGRAWVEVSGGVDLATLPAIGAVAPDFVSCGGLTHAAPWVDLGLDWR